MGAPTLPNTEANYYPNAAMQLSAAAEGMPAPINPPMPDGLEISWGPAFLPVSGGDFTYSLAFVAYNSSTEEYWVVIRGTNPYSRKSWFEEDFHVDNVKPFSDFIPGIDCDIKISDASYTALQDLLQLQDPSTQAFLLDYLQGVNPKYLYLTGHSLGGALVPPMFAYLQANLESTTVMACWSFAGLATGNQEFADYINGIIDWDGWRLVNEYDVAPYLFWNKEGAHDIYGGHPRWTDLDVRLAYIDHVFGAAEKYNYTQPGGYVSMTGTMVPGKHFFDELLDQHAHQTYLTVVAANFPIGVAVP